MEELGIEIQLDDLVGVYSSPRYDVIYPNRDEIQQCCLFFKARWLSGEISVKDSESLEIRFFFPHELPVSRMPLCCQDKAKDLSDFCGIPFIR